MRTYQKVLLGAIGVLLGGVALAVGLLAFAFRGMCGNRVIRTVRSPDQRREAVVFERDCGATTGFSTQLSVVEAGESLGDEAGNVLVAEGGPAGPRGGPVVEVTWESLNVLRVRYYAATRIVRSEPGADGVRIMYDTLRAPGG